MVSCLCTNKSSSSSYLSLLTGPQANKLIFTSSALAPQQPKIVPMILGKQNMLELIGEEHKRVRGAVGQFFRLEVLKKYVSKIDRVVRNHLEKNWMGRRTVTVCALCTYAYVYLCLCVCVTVVCMLCICMCMCRYCL